MKGVMGDFSYEPFGVNFRCFAHRGMPISAMCACLSCFLSGQFFKVYVIWGGGGLVDQRRTRAALLCGLSSGGGHGQASDTKHCQEPRRLLTRTNLRLRRARIARQNSVLGSVYVLRSHVHSLLRLGTRAVASGRTKTTKILLYNRLLVFSLLVRISCGISYIRSLRARGCWRSG